MSEREVLGGVSRKVAKEQATICPIATGDKVLSVEVAGGDETW